MEFIKEDLPYDISELFFSGVFWYCASSEVFIKGKLIGLPVAVGVGKTKEQAVVDMRAIKESKLWILKKSEKALKVVEIMGA